MARVVGPDDVFVGRAAELEQIEETIRRVRDGEPWLITIEGESGIGKSALGRRCIAAAEPCFLLRARADVAEADLDYGMVQQLLDQVDQAIVAGRPLLSGGIPGGAAALAVGAELLAVIGQLQGPSPIVIVVDDVQWADRPSVQALGFALRRLSVDPVLSVIMVRGDRDRLDEPTRRLLTAVERRVHIRLSGLSVEEISPLRTP